MSAARVIWTSRERERADGVLGKPSPTAHAVCEVIVAYAAFCIPSSEFRVPHCEFRVQMSAPFVCSQSRPYAPPSLFPLPHGRSS